MEAKEIIQKFKRIDAWKRKRKSSLTMTKRDLAEYAKIDLEADQKKLDILEADADSRYEEAWIHYSRSHFIGDSGVFEEALQIAAYGIQNKEEG